MSSEDDKKESLDQLSRQSGSSIISQLVDIGAERNQEQHRKFRTFITELRCLRLGGASEGTKLRRTSIDAFKNRQYVALSYTWDCSKYEDCMDKGYHIEEWDIPSFAPSPVRNCVFDRILCYMRHQNVELLWIDRHCIRQDACPGILDGEPCLPSHAACARKRDALQAMDLVYQLSEHPVALLGRPMNDDSDLRLLHRVLSGDFVDSNRGSNGSAPRLSQEASIQDAGMALLLLHKITQDDWWTRAWTFQENYRGGMSMRLLISHPKSLEDLKLQLDAEKGSDVLGDIPGELCLKSVDFSEQASMLCLALRGVAGYLAVGDRMRKIEDVERAAGRYQLLLAKSSSMTPRVLADVESRELSQPWDRLAIVANCCRYPIRLNRAALSHQGRSLSLSLLTMCLINGEILDNGDDDNAAASVGGLTASRALEKLMFKKFRSPENEHRHLTFNRGCRLACVELTASGVAARGHLWKLGCTIETTNFRRKRPLMNDSDGLMKPEDWGLLLQLVSRLYDIKCCGLAKLLDDYVKSEIHASRAGDGLLTFTEAHLLTMAKELAAAIRARRNLRLGRIWYHGSPRSGYSCSSAIFIMPDQNQNCDAQGNPRTPPSFVFTSIWPGDDGSPAIIAHDNDCYASLGVDIEGPQAEDGPPQARIRSWLLGMCFFGGCPRASVVFPWPKALQECNEI